MHATASEILDLVIQNKKTYSAIDNRYYLKHISFGKFLETGT